MSTRENIRLIARTPLELMFLFFKNTVKRLKFRYTFYQNYLSIIIGGTQIINNKRKTHLFYKIIHFSVRVSAIVNRFIVKT